MDKTCDYPGCQRNAIVQCGTLTCTHEVCDIHGNGGIEVDPDHAPIAVCWACDGKGWGEKLSTYLRGGTLR